MIGALFQQKPEKLERFYKPLTTRIATDVIGKYKISTIGILRNPLSGQTYFYETIVFYLSANPEDTNQAQSIIDQRRYHTEEKAREGHKEMVSNIKNNIENLVLS